MNAAKKPSSKTLSQHKHRRRQWVTFFRMCRYGINNFSRNAWLTIAATAVMTITLLVVFVSLVAQTVLLDTVTKLRDQVSMSIYLSTDTAESDAQLVQAEVNKLSSVMSSELISPQQARQNQINDSKGDAETIEAIEEATTRLPWTVRIKVKDINDTNQLQQLVAENQTVKEFIDPKREPSFAGDRRDTIENIGRVAGFVRQLGIIISSVLVGISMLIIFNTIRMAIFNRREEIQMMKLIGAERSFIRGPFLVEAIVYGFFAAIIASALGYTLIALAGPHLQSYGVAIDSLQNTLVIYSAFVLLAMILLGAVIGVVSSLLATRRYLRI